ncbi:recombinase family protein [Selenomonas ruminantium]|uniref:Site-specific DNA recombinase n=1 Tax=Selenomonas ruminantium TaxID=971 RepID=A0A1I0Y6L6_SELRU|nr:recombinase family protein [Selenomonas ruminantium]SFB08098.1 Site-specific DNA recombinase [Selenomonas ruminantium]
MIRYYVRVSSMEQKTDRQLLAYDGADKVYIDKMTGATKERPQLQELLAEVSAGDTVVVKSIDRLSRSTKDLLDIVDSITTAGAGLKILDMNIDTHDKFGEFFLTVLGAIGQLERKTIKERTKEGIVIAKSKGKYTGRKKGAIALKGEPLERFNRFYGLGMNKAELAKEFNVSRPTIYKWIDELKARGEIKEA